MVQYGDVRQSPVHLAGGVRGKSHLLPGVETAVNAFHRPVLGVGAAFLLRRLHAHTEEPNRKWHGGGTFAVHAE